MILPPGPCVRPSHAFDPDSGWCQHGCGWRDDGASTWHPPMPKRELTEPVVDISEPRRGQVLL